MGMAFFDLNGWQIKWKLLSECLLRTVFENFNYIEIVAFYEMFPFAMGRYKSFFFLCEFCFCIENRIIFDVKNTHLKKTRNEYVV